MEKAKIEGEYADLQVKIAHYRSVLASETLVRGIIKDELGEVQAFDKTDRKTQIVPAEGEFQMEDLIADEPVILTISNDDYIKRMPIGTFKEQKRGGQGVIGFDHRKETDMIKDIYVASTHDTIMFFTNFGRVYWVKVWQIPESGRRSKGKPLVNLLEGLSEGERIAAQLRVRRFDEEDTSILLATKRGVVKKTLLESFSAPRRKGVYAINIDEGDEVIAAHLVRLEQQIMLFTREGMAVRFNQDQARPIGRVARGVRGVKLKSSSDRVVSCEVVCGNETVLVVCENGFGKRSSVEQFRHTHRGGVGVRSIITSKRNGQVVSALSVGDKDSVVLMASSGHTLRLSMQDIRVMGRSTQGVKVVNLKNSDILIAMQKIEHLEEEDKEIEEKK